ncbi:MAG: PfkB family carbohydrate kinase, partial [bacterium]|nr:PfkB family carbohydrate kinase [bacterium]
RFYLTSLGGDLALARRILAHAARIGARVAWNPGGAEIAQGWTRMAPLIAQCDVLNLNREEAAALTGVDPKNLNGILTKLWSVRAPACAGCGSDCDMCEALSGVYTLITDGSGGAYAHDGHTTWHIASRNLKAVNTTGAGDAFGSAFFLGLDLGVRKNELGYALDYALRLAMANAEGDITHMCAKAGILRKVPSRTALAKYRVREV